MSLYRIAPAGGEIEQVGPPVDWYNVDGSPDVAPDGQRLLYTTNRVDDYAPHIRVLDIATGGVDSLDVRGESPRWSPDGRTVAFTRDGGIHLMSPDGTYLRQVTTGDRFGWIDWSPDGAWLAASKPGSEGGGSIELVRVDDGERVPLPFATHLKVPRFRAP